MKSFLRLLGGLLLIVVLLVAVMAVHALMLRPETTKVEHAPEMPIDSKGAIDRYSAAIRIRTVSSEGQPPDLAVMSEFREFLKTSFPRVHETMQQEVLPHGALLYTWKGKQSDAAPVILMAHFDVVPVDAKTEGEWKRPPFSGDVVDGVVWGRGSFDDKAQVMALMEAAEALIASGFQPARTILFAFGDDEENGGATGARAIVALLQKRGVKAEMVLDEGGVIAAPGMASVPQAVAMIGVAEKGYLDLVFRTKAAGGHSSQGAEHSAIGRLSAALAKLESHPFTPTMPTAVQEQVETLAPYMSFGQRIITANLWLTKPLVAASGVKSSTLGGSFHTTIAETIFNAGFKPNALPTEARAVVNFRVLPGETIDSVVARVKSVIADAEVSVEVDQSSARNPSPTSPTTGAQWDTLATTVRQVFPDTLVSPFLCTASTDATFYTSLSANVYRLMPLQIEAKDIEMLHGLNEHVPVASYLKSVQFEAQLMRNLR